MPPLRSRYVLTQLAGGALAIRYGPRVVLAGGIFGSAVANLLTPLCIQHSWQLAVCARALSGFFEVRISGSVLL